MANCEERCRFRAEKRKRNSECCDPDDDGLVVQCVGEWEQDKHDPLRDYIYASHRARRKFGGGAFIDLFAGPGRCRVRETGEVHDGSPLIALKHAECPFTQVIMVEQDIENADVLRARTARWPDRAVVIQGDCNAEADTIIRSLPRGLHLAFVDPYKVKQLRFDTLAKLARAESIDILVNVPAHDIQRAWQSQERFTAAAGSEVHGCSAGEVTRNFIETLRRNLASLGLGYGSDVPTVASINSKNRGLMRLIFASRHPLASKLWRSVTRIRRDGQRSFAAFS